MPCSSSHIQATESFKPKKPEQSVQPKIFSQTSAGFFKLAENSVYKMSSQDTVDIMNKTNGLSQQKINSAFDKKVKYEGVQVIDKEITQSRPTTSNDGKRKLTIRDLVKV